MTKAQEKQLLQNTINTLPDGYVRDILADAKLEIERAIDSDFGFIPMRQRVNEMLDHAKAMAEATAKLHALKNEIWEMERTRTRLDNGINQLRSTARQLAAY